jgi:hypothetical protein
MARTWETRVDKQIYLDAKIRISKGVYIQSKLSNIFFSEVNEMYHLFSNAGITSFAETFISLVGSRILLFVLYDQLCNC